MKKDLNDMLTELLETWNTYSDQWTIPRTHETAAQDLQYQIGSLSKLILQLKNYRYREWLSEPQIMEKIGDELADIIAESLFIAHGFGIDMNHAWDQMLASDRKKIKERSDK